MKRILILSIILSCFFCLTGCGNSDLEKERLSVREQNLKVENIMNNYNSNKESFEDFDVLFEMYFRDIEISEGSLNSFSSSLNLEALIEEMHNKITNDLEEYALQYNYISSELVKDFKENSEITFYPFMNEDGSVEEHIYINYLLGKVEVIVNWQNGFIKDCNVYYLRG